jgi:hypothetical protein
MSLQQVLECSPSVIYATVTGDFDLTSAQFLFDEVLLAVAKHRLELVLIDARGATGAPGDLDRFYYGEYVAEATLRVVAETALLPRFAYVMVPPLRDPNRLGMTVASNRGITCCGFDTPEPALRWLRERLRTD